MLRHDIGWFDMKENGTHVLTARLASDAMLVEGLLGSRLGLTIQNVVTIVTGVSIAFIYSWKLTLVILACGPVLAFSNVVSFSPYFSDFLIKC
jgi:ATP-binding cassette subfamily B (MDR/TAP) protein 1